MESVFVLTVAGVLNAVHTSCKAIYYITHSTRAAVSLEVKTFALQSEIVGLIAVP